MYLISIPKTYSFFLQGLFVDFLIDSCLVFGLLRRNRQVMKYDEISEDPLLPNALAQVLY